MRSPNWKWWVCGALLLATFLNYMDRQALAVSSPQLKSEYNLGEKRFGMVEGCFGFAFAAGSIVFGFLADRFGPRRLYPVVLTGWSLAGIATGFAGSAEYTSLLESPGDEAGTGTYLWLLGCRIVLGVFEAGHWPCALITARQILAAKDRPLGNAILQSGASLGAIVIPLYAELMKLFGAGWQVTFWSVGAAGLLWVPLWLLLVGRDDLADQPVKPSFAPMPVGPTDVIGFLRRFFVLAMVVGSLTVCWQFLRAWLVLFLQDFHHYSERDTRFITSGYFVVADAGCILAGFLVKRLVARRWGIHSARVAVFAIFTGLTALAALVPFLGVGPLMIAGLLIAGAGILGLHPIYYALSQDLPHRWMGVLSGTLAASGWIVSGVFQILIGARIQETKSYDVGLVIAGLAPVVGLLALLFVWKPQRQT